MAAVEGLTGLRHVALKVRDIRRAKDFYRQCFGMEVVWEPDPQNVYLSSGCDNLALHESPQGADASTDVGALDHIGFLID
ncbi:MAG: VOC family protein, partial [Candidatus Binatia bacterium]